MSVEKQTPEEIYRSLELESASNYYFRIDFGEGLIICVGCGSSEQIEYLKRVYAQANIAAATYLDLGRSIQIAESVEDYDLKYLRLIALLLGNICPEQEYLGETSRGRVYLPHHEYVTLEDGKGSVWSVTPKPEIGLSSVIRKALMIEEFRRYSNLVAFHANSIVDTRDGGGIVFSSPDIPGAKSKGGKTTIAFAAVLQANSPFAYLSNEDVYLAIRDNSLHNILIPAEINIGVGTYDQLVQDDISLAVERYTFDFNGEKHYMTSAGAIKESGYKIANQMGIPKIWAFVDLKPGEKDHKVVTLEDKAARTMFVSTIKPSRLVHFHTPLVQGERLRAGDIKMYEEIKGQTEQNALDVFEQLIHFDTKFCLISAGVDRQQLYSVVLQLSK